MKVYQLEFTIILIHENRLTSGSDLGVYVAHGLFLDLSLYSNYSPGFWDITVYSDRGLLTFIINSLLLVL